MPLSPDEDRRLREVDERSRKNRDDLAKLTQRVSELENRREDFEDAAKRWVGDAVTHAVARELAPLHADIAELKADNKTQLELLRDAAEERGRRKQREEDAEARRKQAELELAHRRVVIDEKKAEPDIAEVAARARATKRAPYYALATAVLAVIGTIIASLLSKR